VGPAGEGWVCLGMLEAGLRSFLNGVYLNCSEGRAQPLSGIWAAENPPTFRPPYRAHQTPCGAGEANPLMSPILLLISGNVHRAILKQSELI